MPYLSVECKLPDLKRVIRFLQKRMYCAIIILEEVLNLSLELTECG